MIRLWPTHIVGTEIIALSAECNETSSILGMRQPRIIMLKEKSSDPGYDSNVCKDGRPLMAGIEP